MVTKQKGEVARLAEEQAQDLGGSAALDAMAGEVAALDAETSGPAGTAPADDFGPAPVAGQVVQAGGASVGDWIAALALIRATVAPFAPYVATIYTDEALQQIAEAAVPVADKYGLSAGGLFDKWGPEIRLAMVLAPLLMQTYLAYKVQKLEAENAQHAAKSAASEANAAGVLPPQGEPPKNAPAVADSGGVLMPA